MRVDVTSFRYTARGSNVAELCGKVVGDVASPTFIRVTVDHTSSSPGIYNVIARPEHTFCTAVVTYRGTAAAQVWGTTGSSTIGHVDGVPAPETR